jgi:hypothetical protein
MAKRLTKLTLTIVVFFILLILSVVLYTTTHSTSNRVIVKNDNVQENNIAPDAKDQNAIPKERKNGDASVVGNPINLDDLDQLLDTDNLAIWGKLDFTEIRKDELFRSFLSEYQLKNSNCNLSDEQKEEFVNHLEQTCIAYNAGTYEEFEKYRISTGKYTYDSDKLDWFKYVLINYLKTPTSDIPSEPKELVKLYWKKTNESDESFIGLWKAVSKPQVSIQKYSTLPMRLIDMASILNKSAVGGSKLINFERSPSVILKEQKEIIYSDIEYVVKHKTGLAYPIVIRSFWDNESKKWFPNEILICYTEKGRLVDPEF